MRLTCVSKKALKLANQTLLDFLNSSAASLWLSRCGLLFWELARLSECMNLVNMATAKQSRGKMQLLFFQHTLVYKNIVCLSWTIPPAPLWEAKKMVAGCLYRSCLWHFLSPTGSQWETVWKVGQLKRMTASLLCDEFARLAEKKHARRSEQLVVADQKKRYMAWNQKDTSATIWQFGKCVQCCRCVFFLEL